MQENLKYVQYGCGWQAPETWENYDASPTLFFERIPILGKLYTKNEQRFPKNVKYGDITKGVLSENGSCKGVYCSHILEHLSFEDCQKALQNTFLMLKNGGVFRMVLPDLEKHIADYISCSTSDAAIKFMIDTSLGFEKRNTNFAGFLSQWLGGSRHLWMWDYKSLFNELTCIGFSQIRIAVLGDSIEPMFSYVEEEERWTNCLGIECIK